MNWKLRPFMKIGAALGVTCLAIAAYPQFAQGADHIDSASVRASALADINDTYAWMSADAADLNIAMSIGGLGTETFGTAVSYAFHIGRGSVTPDSWPPPTGTESEVRCSFADSTTYECWLVDDTDAVISYVTGTVGDEAGATDNGMTVFVGPRNDAFVFDFAAFAMTVDFARDAAPTLPATSFNDEGCLDDADTAEALRGMLLRGDDAVDAFAAVIAQHIVITIDKTTIPGATDSADDVDNIAVWASTHMIP